MAISGNSVVLHQFPLFVEFLIMPANNYYIQHNGNETTELKLKFETLKFVQMAVQSITILQMAVQSIV